MTLDCLCWAKHIFFISLFILIDDYRWVSLVSFLFPPLSACYKHQVNSINININCIYVSSICGRGLCSRERRGYPHVIVSTALGHSNECVSKPNTKIFICFPVFKKMSNPLMKTHLRVAKWPYWHFFLPNTDENVFNVKALLDENAHSKVHSHCIV